MPDQLLEEVVAVNLTDEGAGIVEIGDIGGVLREKISHNLVDRVVPLFAERVVNRGENLLGTTNFMVLSFIRPTPFRAFPYHIIGKWRSKVKYVLHFSNSSLPRFFLFYRHRV